MSKYASWPTSDAGNVVGSRLANEIEHRFGGAMRQLAFDQQAHASLAELLATTADVFNVKSFGAVGDGVADDTAAINAAVAAASAASGRVHAPRGTYMVDADVSVVVPTNVVIEGAGMGASTFKRIATSVSNQVVLIGSTGTTVQYNCGIRDLTIDGSRPDTTDVPSTKALQIAYVENIVLERVEVKESAHFGIGVKYMGYSNVSNIYTHDHNRDGMTLGEGNYYCNLTNIVAETTGDDGMSIQGHNGNESHHITVNGYTSLAAGSNASTAGNGLRISGASYVTVNNVVITNPGNAGVIVIKHADGTGNSHINIDGLLVQGAGQLANGQGHGVIVQDEATDIRIRGSVDTCDVSGVFVSDAVSRLDLDMRVRNASEYGLFLNGGANNLTDVTVAGTYEVSGYSGIHAESVDGLRIHGVLCRNNNQQASVAAAASAGLSLDGCTNVSIVGPHLIDDQGSPTQTYGLRTHTTACVDFMMLGCHAEGNVTGQITLSSAPTGSFRMWNNHPSNDALDAVPLDYARLALHGAFTSGGGSNRASLLDLGGAVVGASGDTGRLAQLDVTSGSITTQGVGDTVSVVAAVNISEPNITVGSGDTVTNAATLRIGGAPTEGANNFALLVDAGASRFDDDVELDGALNHDGSTVGLFGVTPTTQPTALTAADATAANTGDSATDDVIDNMRTRIGELETKLTALGALAT